MIEPDLHPELATRGSFAHLKTGKLPRKNDPRTLRLAKYLRLETLPEIPPAHDWSTPVSSWPMYGNDRLGDCTFAAAGHMVEAWTANAGAPATPTEDGVIAGYWATGSDDTGRYELDVLNYWRTQGVDGHQIEAFVAVNPQSALDVHAGAFLFGGLYIGIALPLTAQGQAVWDVVGDGKTGSSAPGSWGGHAVDVVAYDADGVTVITWGAPMKVTWAFWQTYVDEAYAIVTADWIAANGDAPSGFAVDELLADLHIVEQTETPAGITIGEPDGVGEGVFALRVPDFPLEFTLKNAVWWIQEMPDGTVVLKFAPANQVPGRGLFPALPATEIRFGNVAAWERFAADVATKGEGTAKAASAVAVPPTQIIVPGH